jgi:cyclophilin family peptidyl-prolyl cis-trans isomerase
MRLSSFAIAFAAMTLSTAALANPVVVIETSQGKIEIEVDEQKAPKSAENFLKYVDDGYYNGTIFHRVIKSFMVQGGGYDTKYAKKDTRGPIKNEADNGLKNDVGTVAMARTGVVDSATSQFFINTKDNQFLNHRSKDQRGYGYAVFGKVVAGMDVVTAIESAPTGRCPGFAKDCPVQQVVIIKAYRKKGDAAAKKAPAKSGGGW